MLKNYFCFFGDELKVGPRHRTVAAREDAGGTPDNLVDGLGRENERREQAQECGDWPQEFDSIHDSLPTPALPGSGSKGSRYGSQVRRPPL